MHRKIMVAMDGSEAAEHALAEALLIAKAMRAQLHLVYVADSTPIISTAVTGVLQQALDEVRNSGDTVLQAARAQCQAAGVQCETELNELFDATDTVSGRLLTCAKNCGADLASLGTHGRSGLRRAFLGSVAENFVRHASFPVLLVRGDQVG